ncbi:MarR family transcriptional regulator [Solibacillus sp. MA9]|uniref:MarR family transcriptional regulator n=1 Tax=Solibacillus palustris TaxID=2908203 RepID=A0ABS9UC50_9BACL|nr:MarR family transcriptional regulator [Solibacillus sp. MA9]MCH7321899.1 MarR family transcriptional regulator [Solibacillus sp. MA9]
MHVHKQLFFELILTFHPFARQLNAYLETYELRRPEWAILYLFINDPELSLTEVGQFLNMDQANVTRAIKYLVKIGYIELQPSKVDRRKKDIFITETGREVYEILQAEIKQFELGLVEGFTEEELAITQRTLETVRARLLQKE